MPSCRFTCVQHFHRRCCVQRSICCAKLFTSPNYSAHKWARSCVCATWLSMAWNVSKLLLEREIRTPINACTRVSDHIAAIFSFTAWNESKFSLRAQRLLVTRANIFRQESKNNQTVFFMSRLISTCFEKLEPNLVHQFVGYRKLSNAAENHESQHCLFCRNPFISLQRHLNSTCGGVLDVVGMCAEKTPSEWIFSVCVCLCVCVFVCVSVLLNFLVKLFVS